MLQPAPMQSTDCCNGPEQKVPSRLVVVENIYHQESGRQPTSVESNYTRFLKTDEEVYRRRMKVGENWMSIESGWIEKPGMIILKNEEVYRGAVNPTPDEIKEVQKKIVEVSSSTLPDCSWFILPGENMRGIPKDLSNIRLRCQHSTAMVSIILIPE